MYQILRRLGGIHDVTLLSYYRQPEELTGLNELEKYCQAVYPVDRGRVWQVKYLLGAALSKYSLLERSYCLHSAKNKITELLSREKFDLIHAEPFYVSHIIPQSAGLPVVIAEHNVEYEVYENFVARYRYIPLLSQLMAYDCWKMRRNERDIWKKATKVVAVSDRDKQEIDSVRNNSDCTVISNGVDPIEFSYTKWRNPKELKFVFVGNFSWPPNIHAVHMLLTQVWPIIRDSYPTAQLTIVGQHLPSVMSVLAKRQGVRLQSWADNIIEVYKNSTALLAPIGIAGGTKFKIIEAMACGTPVLTTPAGITGLHVTPGKEVFVAENSHDYIQSINMIMSNPKEISQMTARARHLVEEKYSWDSLAEQLSATWKQLC